MNHPPHSIIAAIKKQASKAKRMVTTPRPRSRYGCPRSRR